MQRRDTESGRLIKQGVDPAQAAASATQAILYSVANFLVLQGESPTNAVLAAATLLVKYDGSESARRSYGSRQAQIRDTQQRQRLQMLPAQVMQDTISQFRNAFR
jgi:hypothetical protein